MSIENLINKVGIRALHCLDPETSHNATIKMLSTGLAPSFGQIEDKALEYRWGDLTFKNRWAWQLALTKTPKQSPL